MMKEEYIKKFWTKLLASSKSVNKIPTEYLQEAFNARIYDWWIWPRKWKLELVNSVVWTNNKGGFILDSKLYQITNSKIYLIENWGQDEKVDLGYDKRTDILTYWSFVIIVADWESLQVFDWTNLTTPTTVPTSNNGIIEYTRWFSFLASSNILYISRPITEANPEYAYDFTWTDSENITFDSEITWLKGTLNWIYIFTKEKVEFIWANSLQSVAWSATFISTPIWNWWEPVNNLSIVASWDKIFYVTKNQQINTINYVSWIETAQIWELSQKPIVWIREYLKNIDIVQENAFWFYNQNDETIQFHLRKENSIYNNVVIVYDLVNTTFSIDTWKNYNYVVKNGLEYYWFSDLNSSIYIDNVWWSDNGSAIPFKIKTQAMNYWNLREKMFWWILTAWAIWPDTNLKYNVFLDRQSVFSEDIEWQASFISDIGEVWWNAIWETPIWWDIWYNKWEIIPFERIWDEWRMYNLGTRAEIEILSNSNIQDFIIDTLWLRLEHSSNMDISNKF